MATSLMSRFARSYLPAMLTSTMLAVLASALPMAEVIAQTQVESLAQPATYQPTVGEPHPDFVLPSIADGTPIRLSDYRGKKVLLVHFASW